MLKISRLDRSLHKVGITGFQYLAKVSKAVHFLMQSCSKLPKEMHILCACLNRIERNCLRGLCIDGVLFIWQCFVFKKQGGGGGEGYKSNSKESENSVLEKFEPVLIISDRLLWYSYSLIF